MNQPLFLFLLALSPLSLLAEEPFFPPEPRPFSSYQKITQHNPFGPPTAEPITSTTPPFAHDLYITGLISIGKEPTVFIASRDGKTQLVLTPSQPQNNIFLEKIDWAEQVGQSKITLRHNNEIAILTFDQALLSSPPANTNVPLQVFPPSLPAALLPPRTLSTPAAQPRIRRIIRAPRRTPLPPSIPSRKNTQRH